VSSTPGSTRQLNLYEARARDKTVFHLADLPGYGFTRRSKAETASWKLLVERYLTTRSTLSAVVLIIDVRRGLDPDDRELIDFVEGTAIPPRPGGQEAIAVLVVATKLDKVPRASRKVALDAIRKAARRPVLGFSAANGEGKTELWAALRRACNIPMANSLAGTRP
jgi:GTP-binding protein